MTLAFPSGPIQTLCPEGGSCGIEWTAISQWKAQIEDAAAEFGVPPERVAATIVVESRGNRNAIQQNNQNGWSYGLMQVVPRWWKASIEGLAGQSFPNENAAGQAMIDAPSLAIRAGCLVLAAYQRETGSWDQASSKFFTGKLNWVGQDTVNGNTGAEYRRALNQLMEEVMSTTSDWSPVIYDLANDAHALRFGLQPWQRDQILGKRIVNRGGRGVAAIESIGLHVQWGWTGGSLQHWLNVAASSTIMVQQDGSILRVIPPQHGPWTQGDVRNPDAMARALQQRFGQDPNVYSLTIEAEDARTEAINAAQERTIAWQIRQWQIAYPKLAGADWEARILGHYQWNSVDKIDCGKYRNAMVASLAAGGPVLPDVPVYQGLPAWLTPAALEAAFELADPKGVVTKAVIAWAAETGQTPWFLGKTDLGNNRNIWRFEDVTLFNDGSKVWREGKAAA